MRAWLGGVVQRCVAFATGAQTVSARAPPRVRDLGVDLWRLPTGSLNALTDVPGVLVGQVTRMEGDAVRTGVTAILPHAGDQFHDRVPAGLAVANGHGKLAGATQLEELGELETPIVLVNTLSVGRAVEAVIDWTLARPGGERIRSVNAVVGETNDGALNDIRRRGIEQIDVLAAIESAQAGTVDEGCVGCGAGVTAFGFKAGVGTSSRIVETAGDRWRVGVLVQANFGGELRMGGYRIPTPSPSIASGQPLGSIMIIVATDAPMSDRNLRRLAWRALFGMARTGADFSNGSGDYAIAFSTHPEVRRTPARRAGAEAMLELGNEAISPLFLGAIEATEEAILNALVAATPVDSILAQGPVRFDPIDLESLRKK
jgi:D-aminopeptidase